MTATTPREQMRTSIMAPLAGRRVLVTRAREQAGALVALLRAAGATPVASPAISIEPATDYSGLDEALRHVDRYDWAVFTSANTVVEVERRLHAIGRDWVALAPVKVAAIGPRTAADLRARGRIVAYVPDEHSGVALAAGLPLRRGERVLLAQADLADARLVTGLRARGGQVDAYIAYRTAAPGAGGAMARAALAAGEIDAVTFASPSAVRNLCRALGSDARDLLAGTAIACIGPVTAEAVRSEGLCPAVVASEQTIAGLVTAVEEYFLSTIHPAPSGAQSAEQAQPEQAQPEQAQPEQAQIERSQQLFAAAQRVIPGGVSSPVRAFKAVGGTPRFIERGEGPYLYDADGNRYIDYVMSYGPLICGHAHPRIVTALHEAITRGTSYGAPTALETALAGRICRAMPSIELVRFVSSGTEATMSALRVARAFTGRDVIVKVEGGYHGHADPLLARAGSGAITLGVPDSPGVPAAIAATTINVPFNDLAALEAALQGFAVAAFIVEPVPANMGVVLPAPGYLEGARRLTQQYGALLIFDEVISGFRLAYGGAQEIYGVTPDLTCLGKIIGGGLPAGAYGGRRDVMSLVAPLGPVYQAGTLSGNPLAMTAGITTLDLLAAPGTYERLDRLSAVLHEGLVAAARRHGVPVYGTRVGSIGTLFLTNGPVTDYAGARAADTAAYARYFSGMLARGIYLAPAQVEAMFLSTAHAQDHIEETLRAADAVFATF